MKKTSEVNLIRACQRNDFKAQRMLYDGYVDRLYYVVARYISDRYYIENVLQDVFLKAFKHIGSYDQKKGAFSTWIKTIAIRESINFCKKRSLDFQPITASHALIGESGVSPILAKLNADDILKVIANIPEKYRLIFNLYVIDGYSHKEIAQLLQITESTSRAYLTRAKKMIQEQLTCLEGCQIK